MKKRKESPELRRFNEFRREYGETHFPTRELAVRFMELKKEWWGANMRLLGVDSNPDGTYSPAYNYWD